MQVQQRQYLCDLRVFRAPRRHDRGRRTIEPDEFLGLNALVELTIAAGADTDSGADIVSDAKALMRKALADKLKEAGLRGCRPRQRSSSAPPRPQRPLPHAQAHDQQSAGRNRVRRSLGRIGCALVVRKSLCLSLRAFDAGEDLVGVLGPGKGPRVVVPVVDECADGVGQLAD